jgi:hypothetical protein
LELISEGVIDEELSLSEEYEEYTYFTKSIVMEKEWNC